MSITAKIETIAENEPLVYESGKNREYARMAESYRKKGVEVEATPPAQYDNFIDDAFDKMVVEYCEGRQNFSTAWQQMRLENAFSIDYTNATSIGYMYRQCPQLKNGGDISFFSTSGAGDIFEGCTALEKVGNIYMPNTQSANYVFSGCRNLRKIGNMNISSCTNAINTFAACEKLEDVTFEGIIKCNINFSACYLLTHDSLMSIINALEDKRDWAEREYTVGIESVSYLTLPNIDIKPGLVTIENIAIMNDESTAILANVSVTDNGNGKFLHPEYGELGSIDYKTGAITITRDYIVGESNIIYSYYTEYTGSTTYLLNLGEKNLAKLTEDEKAIIEKKGWDYQ